MQKTSKNKCKQNQTNTWMCLMCILLTPWKQWKGRAALRSRWKPRFLISKICQPTEYGSDILSHWMWHCAAADYLNDDVLTTWRPDNAAIVSILSLETVKHTQGPLGSRARSHGHFTVIVRIIKIRHIRYITYLENLYFPPVYPEHRMSWSQVERQQRAQTPRHVASRRCLLP